MALGFLCGQPFLDGVSACEQQRGGGLYLMIVAQQLVEEVDGFISDKSLVLRRDKAVPGFLLESAQDVVVLRVELNLVLVQVVEQVIGAQNLGDLDQLIRVAVSVEEGLLAEDHGGEHSAETPHVEGVVVLLEVDEQLRPLEVPRRDAHVVLCAGVVELGQTPVDETKLRGQSCCCQTRGGYELCAAHGRS